MCKSQIKKRMKGTMQNKRLARGGQFTGTFPSISFSASDTSGFLPLETVVKMWYYLYDRSGSFFMKKQGTFSKEIESDNFLSCQLLKPVPFFMLGETK